MAKNASVVLEIVPDRVPNWSIIYKRPDGSYLISIEGLSVLYHVDASDNPELFAAVDEAAQGQDIPFEPEPEPPEVIETPPQTFLIASAELGTAGGEITGIESASGIGFAMMISDGVFWLFFNTPQPDAKYLAFAQSPGFNVDVTAREADYMEVTVTDRTTNQPAIPASLAITVQRTQ